MPFDTDELSANANGGTEMMGRGLQARLDPQLFERVHIIRSRVRTISHTLPNVLWLHDLPQDPESARLSDPNFRAQFAKFVFVSEWQQQQYNLFHGIPFHRGVVIHNAIEPVVDLATLAKPDSREQLRLIYHTTPHRGLSLVATCMERLYEDFPDANIHLDVFSSFEAYGWKERDRPFEELFHRIAAHPWITYHGWKPNGVVLDHLRTAHAFVYPSIWPETSCIAAIESMAHGCRVLTTTLGALPETLSVDPESTARLTRFSRDHSELLDTYYTRLHAYVSRLLYRTNAKPFNEHTIDRVNQRHGWPTIVRHWERVLSEVLDKTR